ncbi:MAG: hypothetical protein Kow00122_00070 [Thermoleophilia bacterium]
MDSYAWAATPFSWDLAELFQRELHIPLVVGIVFAARGFRTVEDVRRFLEVDPVTPDPFAFADMGRVVDLLECALATGRRVVVHGDYDVDGISATALMVRGLAAFGLVAEPYLPNRFVQGYGLSRTAVEEIAAGGDGLLVTVDCGVNYPEEVELARRLGLDVVVTDHHRLAGPRPDCPTIHPEVGAYPGTHLCGVGLALKVLHALHVARHGDPRDRIPDDLQEHLDLVALGTVADLVPLTGENRTYVHDGLGWLAQGRKVGLRALIAVAGAQGRVDAHTVGYRLAPRLNAAGRLADPRKPLRLLLTDDEHEARLLAEELDGLNRQRQEVESHIVREAVEQVEALEELPAALVLAAEGWHEGVIGIVASRLVERYHRPTVLLALKGETAKGSGRSIAAYDLMSGLEACRDLLAVFGGHQQAAGLTLPARNIAPFAEALATHARRALTPADLVRRFTPDAIVRGEELNLETADALGRMAPFGMGNPRVRLLAVGARLEDVATTRAGDHLRCTLVVGGVRTRCIGFGMADTRPSLEANGFHAHVGLRLEADEWQGVTRTEVHLHSLYARRTAGEESLGCVPGCPHLAPLDTPPACARCTDPYAHVTRPQDLRGRDLRDCREPLAAVAQILSSGEPAVVIGDPVTHVLRRVAGDLPLVELGVRGVDCQSRLCWRSRPAALRPEALLFTDWTAAERRAELLRPRRHVLVLGPPYRSTHTGLVEDLAQGGAHVHLLYGQTERQATVESLRFTLHPRYWMVTLLRVWRDGFRGRDALAETARRAWAEHEVLPSAEDLVQASGILASLGITPDTTETATMKADENPLYAAADAAYKEAVDLCRKM